LPREQYAGSYGRCPGRHAYTLSDAEPVADFHTHDDAYLRRYIYLHSHADADRYPDADTDYYPNAYASPLS
jgi:hypothetical protein